MSGVIRSLPSAERRNAQIEKEMLIMVFGLIKLHHYTYGRDIEVVTDHKPVETIRVKPTVKAGRCLQHILLKSQELFGIVVGRLERKTRTDCMLQK